MDRTWRSRAEGPLLAARPNYQSQWSPRRRARAVAWRQRHLGTQRSPLVTGCDGGGGAGGSSRRGRLLRGRVTIGRRPRFLSLLDPLGECPSPVNPRRVHSFVSGDRAAPALGHSLRLTAGPRGSADPWALPSSVWGSGGGQKLGETEGRSVAERWRPAAWGGREGGSRGGWDAGRSR